MASFLFIFGNHLTNRLLNRYISEKQGAIKITQTHGGNANMRINMNGTTITGSVSEVLATLTHLGIEASDTNPVTSTEVTETAVTGAPEVAGDGYVVALAPKGSYLPISYDEMAEQLAKLHAGETVTPENTPKLTRDGVVQQAIDDVKDLLSRNYSSRTEVAKFVGETLWFVSEGGLYTVTDEVLFAINADKRTVVASIRYNQNPKDVYKQGRAKCAPGDVFNEHIGKAIALRRALGLTVPVEYYEVEARDSDDLAVGDVVKGIEEGHQYELIAERDNPAPWQHAGVAFSTNTHEWAASSQVTLINDSARHTAPDLEVSRIIRH